MSRILQAAKRLGFVRSESEKPLPGVLPPSRHAAGKAVGAERALGISTVFRATQIHAVATSQLSLDVERAEPLESVPAIIRKPDTEMSRSAFLEQTVVSLALHGNAYWRVTGRNKDGHASSVQCLDPNAINVSRNNNGKLVYSYGAKALPAKDVRHLALMRVPGRLTGLGPIQAAQVELSGALDLRDYAGKWFDEAGIPSGVLTTDQTLAPGQAGEYKQAWNDTHDGGVRVLGHGLKYSPILLNPADAQFLENQQFTVTQIARLFGIPASLMLAAIEGGSQSYANVEQDWIGYIRFSLMSYLREIEEALTSLLPRGHTVRFNIETLLRTDTKTRYEAHEIALRAKFMDIDEVRKIEGLD